jgi:hypothetical protein
MDGKSNAGNSPKAAKSVFRRGLGWFGFYVDGPKSFPSLLGSAKEVMMTCSVMSNAD